MAGLVWLNLAAPAGVGMEKEGPRYRCPRDVRNSSVSIWVNSGAYELKKKKKKKKGPQNNDNDLFFFLRVSNTSPPDIDFSSGHPSILSVVGTVSSGHFFPHPFFALEPPPVLWKKKKSRLRNIISQVLTPFSLSCLSLHSLASQLVWFTSELSQYWHY